MIKHNIIFSSGTDWTLDITKAEGSFIWDQNNKRLIDFTSAWNVTNLGWNNKEVTEAIIAQAKENTTSALESTDEIQRNYAKELISSLPEGLDTIGRTTGGSESNEEALKTALAFTKRKKILGFINTYHGQTFSELALGNISSDLPDLAPLLPEITHIEFPDTYRNSGSEEEILEAFLEKLERLLRKEDVAAVLTEVGIITGWGSTYTAPKGYLKKVRELTEKYGTLLIIDEVGTGFSRCGKLFGIELEDVTPDIITFAKGISNGQAPIGAMVTKKEIAEKTWRETNLISTFGWLPLSCAAALKTLEIHKKDKVFEKALVDGEYIREVLKRELKNNPLVGDVRGKGMEIGLDLVKDKTSKEKNKDLFIKVRSKAYENGLLLIGDGAGNFQIMPSLVIDRQTLDKGLEILIGCLNN